MPGGPISENEHGGILFPTVLQIQDDVLKYWTSMTCLYDRYWTASADTPTLPICMFHVTEISPVYSVETSRKRVILHEEHGNRLLDSETLANQMRPNVMRTIMDNSVKQPTVYNVEAIVPFQPVGRYVKQGAKIVTDMIASFTEIAGGNKKASDTLSDIFATNSTIMSIVETSLRTADRIPHVDGESYINMDSLEAMAASCRTLCMKMWTGYRYKFVEITGLSSKKKGNEDDVFRVNMTLQERPILTVSRPKLDNPPVHESTRYLKIATSMQRVIVSPLVALTNVRGKDAANDLGGNSSFDKIWG